MLSGSNDTTIKIWDVRQGQILYTLYGHEGSASAVNFSNCGDFFASGGEDSIVMVWKSNLATGLPDTSEGLVNVAGLSNAMKSNVHTELIDRKSGRKQRGFSSPS